MGKITYDWTAKITGSAYSDATANKITAPHGKVIIAIQAVGLTTSSNILVELVAEDSSLFANSVAAAHVGTTSDTVDESGNVSGAATFTMDTSYVTKGYAVGWYVDGVGIPYGTKVAAVNVGDAVKEITLDTNVDLVDGQTIYFTNPNDKVHGTGGRNVTTGTNMALVSEGHTIFGRWHAVRPADGDGNGIIAYFGE